MRVEERVKFEKIRTKEKRRNREKVISVARVISMGRGYFFNRQQA